MPAVTTLAHMPSVVVGRKLCTSPHHKGPRWLPVSYFAVQSWTDESKTVAKRISSTCKTCDVLRQRIRGGHKPRTSKLGIRTGPNGYEPQNQKERDIYREYKRQAYENWTEDQREKRREYQRIRLDAKRKEAGIVPRKEVQASPWRSAVPQPEEPTLDASRLSVFLTEMVHRHGIAATSRGASIGDATLHDIIDGVTTEVPLELADRILTGLGYPEELYIMYPQEEERA